MPVSGTWRVYYNFWSSVDNNQRNLGALYQNFERIAPTGYRTKLVGADNIWETVGKEALFHAEKEDIFFLKTSLQDNGIFDIITCFEFVSI